VIYKIRSGYGGNVRVLSYLLTVKPLWYQQWWCLPLVVLLAWIALAWVLYRILSLRAERLRRKLEQKIYMHELEAQSLLGQLNPHFIFNILMPLQGFFMRGEKLKGLDYLDHFSGLMRGVLQGIRHRYRALAAELAFLEQYMQVQQVRFQHCFVYKIHIDPDLDTASCFIPSLLLQPLVENAIEHGIIKNRNDGRIDLHFKTLRDTIEIIIKNNGKGLPEDWSIKPDHALAIISERVQLLQKTKGTGFFCIANHKDGSEGVTVKLILAKDNRI
jgi:LytS/YehU family sensor histidine kinase